jgi:hypothetical protein
MTRRLVTSLIVGMLALSGPLAYSDHAVAGLATQADLDSAVTEALARDDASRTDITSLLRRDDVRALAAGYGIDTRRAEAAVSTLEGDELQRLSVLAADANTHLAGGDQVIRISLIAAWLIVISVSLLTD